MRDVKTLLQLMLDNQHLFKDGLCKWGWNLFLNKHISWEEWFILHGYIQNNRPSKYSSINAFLNRKYDFYWTIDEIKPRIKWLKHHINKLS